MTVSVDDARPRRGLATARSVLHVLALPRGEPRGRPRRRGRARRGEDPARRPTTCSRAWSRRATPRTTAGSTGRATATPRPPRPAVPDGRHALEDAVDDLFLRTHKRCYLGVVRGGVIEITVVRGRQGIACMPGLGTRITENAHALAMGKVVLARLGADGRRALRRPAACTATRANTITDPAALARELSAVRDAGLRRRARGVRRGLLLRRRPGARTSAASCAGSSACRRPRTRSTPSTTSSPRRSCARPRGLAGPPGPSYEPPFQHRAEKHGFLERCPDRSYGRAAASRKAGRVSVCPKPPRRRSRP